MAIRNLHYLVSYLIETSKFESYENEKYERLLSRNPKKGRGGVDLSTGKVAVPPAEGEGFPSFASFLAGSVGGDAGGDAGGGGGGRSFISDLGVGVGDPNGTYCLPTSLCSKLRSTVSLWTGKLGIKTYLRCVPTTPSPLTFELATLAAISNSMTNGPHVFALSIQNSVALRTANTSIPLTQIPDKNHGQSPQVSHIIGFKDLALIRGTIAVQSITHAAVSLILAGKCHTSPQRDLKNPLIVFINKSFYLSPDNTITTIKVSTFCEDSIPF
uniref:Uncharacterized protein n=1 Tax=Glossina palpalis gambiensis TaxID=67801 RepID=A0A1B0ALT9_9MUSC